MAVKAEDRAELERRGVWKDFLMRRDELKGGGLPPKEACAQAVMELLSGNVKGKVSVKSEDGGNDDLGILSDVIEAQIKELPKKSRPTDMIQWVAANLRGDVDYADCPGRDAFSLLLDCQNFPAFRLDFWKSMYTRIIPNRAALSDDDVEVDLSGGLAATVLKKISDISNKIKADQDKRDTNNTENG